ncbi:MAG TPA: hypothetical protein VGR11_03000, partial [Solirubrobacteraceae bacterium]|nr:hypothetical protein [Solirubrobacteraceae bacterium]
NGATIRLRLMRRLATFAGLLAVALAAAVAPAAAKTKAKAPTATSTPANAKPAKRKGTPVSSRGLETILQDDGLLLYRPPAEVEAAVVKMRELGIDRVRITASWSSLTRAPEEETKPAGFDAADPGAYEQARWAGLDTAIRAIRAAGLKALVDIGFWAPHWATDDPPGPRARSNIDPQAYADFATAVALRYSGAFTPPAAGPAPAPTEDASLIAELIRPVVPFPVPDPLPPPRRASAPAAQPASAGGPLPNVDRFIIWNEPNHQGLLLPQWKADGRTPASPAVYRAMLRAGYAAVKAARRTATVLIGNTSSTGGVRGRGPVPPLEFLRELACVDAKFKPRSGGDCAGFTQLPGDGWAHHPYSQNERPERVSDPKKERGDLRIADTPVLAKTLDRLVRLGRLAPGNRNIHLTEFGYETKGIPGRPRVSETQQARWMTWAEHIADRVPRVRSFAQFLLRDQPPAPVRVSQSDKRPFGEYSTGLLNIDGSDKVIARTFLAGLFAQLQPRRKVLIYGRLRLGPGRKVVALQRQVKGGSWTRIARLSIDGRHSFQRTISHRRGASYRITYPDADGKRRTGLAVRPVRGAR